MDAFLSKQFMTALVQRIDMKEWNHDKIASKYIYMWLNYSNYNVLF